MDNEENNETTLAPVVQKTTGLMTAESNRAIAEIQGQMVIARQFPRVSTVYLPRILEACQRKKLAQAAAYAYPRGGTMVTGPSIRLAEVIAQNYGNLDFGVRELEQKQGESLVQTFCYDLETNVRSQKTFTVRHVRWTKNGGNKALKDPRDIYEAIANYGARRLRNCILAVIPGDIVDKALEECEKTNSDQGSIPIKDKINSMIIMFAKYSVTVEMLEKRLQHKIEATDWAEISTLAKIYNSLNDGMAKRQDFFELPKGEKEVDEKMNDLKKGLENDKTEITIKGEGSPPSVEPEASSEPEAGAKTNPDHQTEMKMTEPLKSSNEVEKIEVPKKEPEKLSSVQQALQDQIKKNKNKQASK